ncbi:hypothetical protein [Mesorhizobium sp. CO1-1-8]|nr:hypothetical protein [Mesorhizobium sp. CO1-1-8]
MLALPLGAGLNAGSSLPAGVTEADVADGVRALYDRVAIQPIPLPGR